MTFTKSYKPITEINYLKIIFCAVFFVITHATHLYAQKEDSIFTKQKISLKETLIDSLIQDQKSFRRMFPQSLKKENLFSLSPKTKNIDLEYELLGKKNTFWNSSYSKFIIPTALISYGLITRGNSSLLSLDHSTNNEIKEHVSKHIAYDDYSQYVPSIAVYGLDWAGIKAKHNLRDRTLIMATSYLIMGATVQTMKTSFGVERPDGSNKHSFPSGHTATAFVGAHIFFKEYEDISPWLRISGYAIASATGALRIYNKKHWISDVVAGAGVGILSTEVGYMLLPTWHKILKIKDKDKSLVITPIISSSCAGVGLAYTF